jgi:Xaa-Pro aminopeptidase
LFEANRERLRKLLLPNSLAVVNANDILPTNADGSLRLIPNADLFYLAGIEQEQSVFVLCPEARDEKHREMLFIRKPGEDTEIWEGHKLTKDEARQISGIKHVYWLEEFEKIFHRLMCESNHVYLNSNEHSRAELTVETRESRFVADVVKRYPLHDYHRLAQLLHRLRVVKSPEEVELIKRACAITKAGFERVAKFVKPGVHEYEIEAEFAHEFTRRRGAFAYTPIIASGKNACALHHIANDQTCRRGELLLLDVAASYANYNSDLTRTIPVTGRFTRRQKQVYDAVLRVLRAQIEGLTVGKTWTQWQKEAEQHMERELLGLELLTERDIKRQDPEQPAVKKYFMHGVGHPLGLDVHDLGLLKEPFRAGWMMTVEPGIYIPQEGFAVRLENDVLIGDNKAIDLMADIPIEADEIEELMDETRRHH